MWCVSTLTPVWLMLISTSVAFGQTLTFSLGDRSVRVPSPEGFFRIDGRSEAFDRFANTTVPSMNRLLAVYGSEVDLADLMRGEFPANDRTFSVQVPRRLEKRSYSHWDFKKLRDRVREVLNEGLRDHPDLDAKLHATVKEIEEQTSEELSGQLGGDVDYALSDITQLGVFDETPASILSTNLSNLYVGGEEIDPLDDVIVTAVGLVHVNRRLIQLTVTSTYETGDDIIWARDSLRAWRDSVVAANTPAPPSQEFLDGNRGRFKAVQFHSDSYGYRIELPHDWDEIPQDVIQKAVALIRKPNATVSGTYDAAFQLDSADEWFEYPYVIVAVIPYAELGLHRQLNEDEFPEYVRLMTGADVGKLLDEDLSSLGRQIITNVDVGQPQLDVANRRFLLTMNSNVQGLGPARTFLVGYFGRDSMVQVMFHSRRANWDRYADVRATIVDSFRFDPDKAYSVQVAASNPSAPSNWWRRRGEVMAGGILVGLVVLIYRGVAAAKRKKTGVTLDAVDEDSR